MQITDFAKIFQRPKNRTIASIIHVRLDQQVKTVALDLPGGISITISDEGNNLSLVDVTGNRVELSPSGISLVSPKDIRIDATGSIALNAKGSITLDATGSLGLKSKQGVHLEGMNVDIDAQIELSAKGNASAELSASGQTTIKGALVMIN